MFSKFKLEFDETDFLQLDLEKYKSIGEDFYKELENEFKNKIQTNLQSFTEKDNIINATNLQANWFSTERSFDVFLSHSHNDKQSAIVLAGFLKKELNLEIFIDSCLWGYSNDLLRTIDEKYCIRKKHSYNSFNRVFDYKKRNYSTSHVHMMLTSALDQMIDKCESFFFLKSKNSISFKEEISQPQTSSPWIFHELSMTQLIRTKKPNRYLTESKDLTMKYTVKAFDKLYPLSLHDLQECIKKWEENCENFESALDYIYRDKNIYNS